MFFISSNLLVDAGNEFELKTLGAGLATNFYAGQPGLDLLVNAANEPHLLTDAVVEVAFLFIIRN